jgi:hypothetical protein
MGEPPPVQQKRDLVLAADQRGEVARMPGLEPTRGPAFAGYLPGPYRRREAVQGPGAEISQVEQLSEQAPGAVGEDNRSRLRELLQARREVRRLAHDRLLARRPLANHVADDDQAGRNAQPGLEHQIVIRPEPAYLADDGERRPHRPFRVVFLRTGIAEVGEHAVAHVLGYVPSERCDLAGNRVLVGPDDLAHLFGIELRRQGRGTHQVDEHHRELPPLSFRRPSFRGGRGFGRNRGRLARQTGDRFEQLPAGTEWQAELIQIALGQLREHLPINLVLAERGLITLQAQLPQPSRNVHGDPRRQDEAIRS